MGLVGEGINGPFHPRGAMGSRKGASNLTKTGDVSPESVTSNLRTER